MTNDDPDVPAVQHLDLTDTVYVAPHREGGGLCTRCSVTWPCRSIIIGYDVEPAWASVDDLDQLDRDYAFERAMLVLSDLVLDGGTRWPGSNGHQRIAYYANLEHRPELLDDDGALVTKWSLHPGEGSVAFCSNCGWSSEDEPPF